MEVEVEQMSKVGLEALPGPVKCEELLARNC